MAFALPLAIAATVAGGITKAYGDYRTDEGLADAARYQQQYATQLAGAYETRGQQMRAAAGQQAADVGLRYGAQAAREAVYASAGNITGPSVAGTIASTRALGQLAQQRTIATGESQAYEEFLRGREETAKAGLEGAAAQQYAAAAPIAAAGDIFSAVGSATGMAMAPGAFTPSAGGGAAQSVAPRWYDNISATDPNYWSG